MRCWRRCNRTPPGSSRAGGSQRGYLVSLNKIAILAALAAIVTSVRLLVIALGNDEIGDAVASVVGMTGSVYLLLLGSLGGAEKYVRRGISLCFVIAACGTFSLATRDEVKVEPAVETKRMDAFERHLVVSAAIWHIGGDPENPWLVQVITGQGRRGHDEIVSYCAEYLSDLEDPTIPLPALDAGAELTEALATWSRCQRTATEILTSVR